MFDVILQEILSLHWTFWLTLILNIVTLAFAAAAYKGTRKPRVKIVDPTIPNKEDAPAEETEKTQPETTTEESKPEKKDHDGAKQTSKTTYVFI